MIKVDGKFVPAQKVDGKWVPIPDAKLVYTKDGMEIQGGAEFEEKKDNDEE